MFGGSKSQEEELAFLEEADELMKELCGFKTLKREDSITGGLTNRACAYSTDQGKFFAKYALRENATRMFNAEVESLRLLRQTNTFRFPKPVKVIEVKGQGAMLVMEMMENMAKINSQWSKLGDSLARLHNHNPELVRKNKQGGTSVHSDHEAIPVTKFGFSQETFYGPCFTTPAVWCDTWEEFFVKYQLKPPFDELEKQGEREFIELWSELAVHVHKYKRSDEPPSLCHGDFCAINLGEIGEELVMFDPCCLYAPGETDLSIPEMMPGNMKPDFYASYHKLRPKAPDHDLQMSAQMAFAYPMVYIIPGQDEVTKEEALDKIKEFLELLKKL